jgi:hypothetical protein
LFILQKLYGVIEFALGVEIPDSVFYILWATRYFELAHSRSAHNRDVGDILAKIETRLRTFHPTESRRIILEQEYRIEDNLEHYILGGSGDENVLRAIFELMLPMTVKEYDERKGDVCI